jgi:hypothetical protein
MARDLKKFVNPKFVRTCDLKLMRRLLAPHKPKIDGFDLGVLDGGEKEARERLGEFLQGDERKYPAGLKADLHRIAELGTGHGMRLLIERAKVEQVNLRPKGIAKKDWKPDAKQLALLCFLDHPSTFNAASDLLAIETRVALSEFRGLTEGAAATLDQATKEAFEQAAKTFLTAELQGNYCRVGWYEDGGEINVVVVHGMELVTETVIEKNEEKVISFQPAGTAVLSYDPVDGRLKVGGLAKAQRQPFADIFAAAMLAQPQFFGGDDAQHLYTLAPVEKAGFDFQFDHRFDPGIRSVKVTEVQADKVASAGGKSPRRLWSVVVRDREQALQRMKQSTKVSFPAYSLTHIALSIEFDAETGRKPSVPVKLVPPRDAQFKRHAFEGRVMELLRRNGLCVERKSDQAAIAAE